jgi:hypothetical protein
VLHLCPETGSVKYILSVRFILVLIDKKAKQRKAEDKKREGRNYDSKITIPTGVRRLLTYRVYTA